MSTICGEFHNRKTNGFNRREALITRCATRIDRKLCNSPIPEICRKSRVWSDL